MDKKLTYTYVHWEHFELDTGKRIKGGTQSLMTSSSRIIGPGVNNALIARLKKGESIELRIEPLNLRAIFKPVGPQ